MSQAIPVGDWVVRIQITAFPISAGAGWKRHGAYFEARRVCSSKNCFRLARVQGEDDTRNRGYQFETGNYHTLCMCYNKLSKEHSGQSKRRSRQRTYLKAVGLTGTHVFYVKEEEATGHT